MSKNLSKNKALFQPADTSQVVDWTNYARAYDLLLEHNPAYRELIDAFWIFSLPLNLSGAKCLDVGGGTGNFSRILLETKQGLSLDFLEPDPGMRQHAERKFSGHEVNFIPESFEECELENSRYDLIFCTHALYTMKNPRIALEKLFRIAKPGGRLFLIDLIKELNILDWRLYLLRHIFLRNSPIKAFEILRRSGPIASENNRVKDLQASGFYWTPSDDELRSAISETGWRIETFRSAYRGYSRIVEAVK